MLKTKVAMHNIQLEKRQAMLTAEQTFFKEISKTLNNEQIAQYLELEKIFNMEMHKLSNANHPGNGHHPMNGNCRSGHAQQHDCHRTDMPTDTPA